MPKQRSNQRKAETIQLQSINRDDAAGRRVGSLLVVQGAEVDLGRHVVCTEPVTLGRDDAATLRLNDGSISRLHCRVELSGDGSHYVLVDLGSTNGTLVNQRRVNQQYPLTEGDKIFLGASVITFRLSDDLDIQYQSRVEEIVSTDPLTGLSSRRQYDIDSARAFERAELEGIDLSMMVLDMDGLKEINDTHGHEMGSFAICEVASLIGGVLLPVGSVYRFGGDEFVALLPEVERDRAIRLAEALRDRVAGHPFISNGIRIEPTLSIGVAAFPEDTDDASDLFDVADKALYRAKRAGKNRVATASYTRY